MSVSNQTDKIYGAGNGVTMVFSFPFKIFDPTQLTVFLINTTSLVVTGPLVLNTDYTVVINPVTEGGTVTFIVAPPTGSNWFVKRVVPYTQSAIIPTEGALPGLQISNQLDLITMMVIQDQEAVSRAYQLEPTSTFAGPVYMADPVDGAIQQYDAAKGMFVNITATGGFLPSPAGGGFVYSNGAGYALSVSVDGSLISGLGNIGSGAGIIPVANLPTGTTANKIVKLDGSGKLPVIDGSQLINLPASAISGILGVPVSKSPSTLYQAATDGFVVGYGNYGGGAEAAIEIGSTSATSNEIVYQQSADVGGQTVLNSLCTLVPKGWYWKTGGAGGGDLSSSLYWISIGS